MDPCDLIDLNLKFFDRIKPKSQLPSYTVLATINNNETGELLALATGTQASLKVYTDDIEDCHAESLVKRAYKRYLIQRILDTQCNNREEMKLLLTNEYNQQLIFFISQFPCGLLKRYEGDPLIDQITGHVIDRKPGRGQMKNNQLVHVERQCCFSKLKRWLLNGLQGKSFKQLLSVHSRIRQVVIGDCEQEAIFDYEPHIETMKLSIPPEASGDVSFIGVKMRRDEFVYSPDKQAQPVSVVWWRQTNSTENFELIVDGRKKGLTKKQCLSDDNRFKLKIGDQLINRDLDMIKSMLAPDDDDDDDDDEDR